MKYNLKDINGNEIIDFLNSLNTDMYRIDDISIELNSFVFEKQRIEKDRYILDFTASYNNWGTSQDISDNKLIITEHDLRFSLNEPFEGDGTDRILKTIFENWLENHVFYDQTQNFFDKVQYAYEKIPDVTFNDVKGMDNIIKILTEAKSLMKE